MCRHSIGNSGGNCRCGGASLERFMQPCLLLLLHNRKIHGYELIQYLGEYGFAENELDPGTVYRHLRRMEEEGFISSEWDTSKGGPAKRLYQLTPEGVDVLHVWAEHITHNIRRLSKFIESYTGKFTGK